MKFKNVDDVVRWRMCVGCGACVYGCPNGNISLVDIETDGIRPFIKAGACESCGACVQVCPGVGVDGRTMFNQRSIMSELVKCWGSIQGVWEGFAATPNVRFQGSSGGLATALAAYCIEKERMAGVLHTGSDPNVTLKNSTHFSRSTSELLNHAGSRYAPASPCDELKQIEAAQHKCVFIGKGCDVAGVRKASLVRPKLSRKIGGVIGIFCAGTPSSHATHNLLKRFGVESNGVKEIRYRGKGWPGNFTVTMSDGRTLINIPYMEAWSFLQQYRPFRCYLCPDSTAELADISCGDPWYRMKTEDNQGFSLALVRTVRGREILDGAVQAGYVVVEPRGPEVLVGSQKGMIQKRGAIWGRLIAMKLLGIPIPRYYGFNLYKNWKDLTAETKLRCILGTVKRIITRQYYRPKGG